MSSYWIGRVERIGRTGYRLLGVCQADRTCHASRTSLCEFGEAGSDCQRGVTKSVKRLASKECGLQEDIDGGPKPEAGNPQSPESRYSKLPSCNSRCIPSTNTLAAVMALASRGQAILDAIQTGIGDILKFPSIEVKTQTSIDVKFEVLHQRVYMRDFTFVDTPSTPRNALATPFWSHCPSFA
jgi:hypothetical protein